MPIGLVPPLGPLVPEGLSGSSGSGSLPGLFGSLGDESLELVSALGRCGPPGSLELAP